MANDEELILQIKAGDESKLLELWRAADGGSLRFRRSVSKSTVGNLIRLCQNGTVNRRNLCQNGTVQKRFRSCTVPNWHNQ